MATTDSPDVWCALEIMKAGVAIQRGRISQADLDAWTRGDRAGSIALHDAYWLDKGSTWEVLGGMNAGPWTNATGVVYVRADIVISIVMMRDGDERALHSMSDDGPAT